MTGNGTFTSKVVDSLKNWQTGNGNGKHDLYSIVFDNKYASTDLSWPHLKNIDKKLALAVKSAALMARMEIYLASLTCFKSSGITRCGDDSLELCDGEKCHTFSNFFNLAGSAWNTEQNTSKVNALAMDCGRDEKEGQKERWEHRMALVLWPTASTDAIMKRKEVNVHVAFCHEWAQQFAELNSDLQKESRGTAFVASISRLETESEKIPFSFIYIDSRKKVGKQYFDCDAGIELISALQRTNNEHLFCLFVQELLTASNICDISSNVFKILLDCTKQFGSHICLPLIKKLAEDTKNFHAAVMLLKELCISENRDLAHYKEVIATLAPQVLANLENAEDQRKRAQESQFIYSQNASPLDFKVSATAMSLLCIYSALNSPDGLERVIRYFRRTSTRHPISTVIAYVLYHWSAWLEKMANSEPDHFSSLEFAFEQKTRLVEDCIEQLNKSLEMLKVSQNKIRIVEIPCHCKDCKILKDFMQDPELNVLAIAIEELCQPTMHITSSAEGIPDLCMSVNSQCITMVKKKKAPCKKQMKSYLQSRDTICKLLRLLPSDHFLNLKEQMDLDTTPPIKRSKIESPSLPQNS